MTKVFFDSGISLDGFIAGANRGPDNPSGTTVRASTKRQRFGVEIVDAVLRDPSHT